MRTQLAWAAVVACCGWTMQGQGTVNFANGAAGVSAPVTMARSGEPVNGADWRAELLLVDAGGKTQRITEPIGFVGEDAPGFFLGGSVAVPDILIGTNATFQIRVYDTNGVFEGVSAPVTIALGGDKVPPANLEGLEPWQVKLVRPRLEARREGDELVVGWPAEAVGFVPEASSTLASGSWSPIQEIPLVKGDHWEVRLTFALGPRFLRLRSM